MYICDGKDGFSSHSVLHDPSEIILGWFAAHFLSIMENIWAIKYFCGQSDWLID